MTKQVQLKWFNSIFNVEEFVNELLNKGCHSIRVSYSAKRDLTMGWLVTWLDPHQPNLSGKLWMISELAYERAMKEVNDSTRGA